MKHKYVHNGMLYSVHVCKHCVYSHFMIYLRVRFEALHGVLISFRFAVTSVGVKTSKSETETSYKLSETESLQTESLQTETLQSETLQSETLQSETLQSETLQSETLQSETLQSETLQSETLQSETLQSETLQSETKTS